MSPEDARHGTYAGWQIHAKEGTSCEPCRRALAAYTKRQRYKFAQTGPERVPLGEQAWRIVDRHGRRELSRVTGLRDSYLSRIRAGGPDTKVYRRTRDKILAARPPATPIGVQRRLRALHALGYSGAQLAAQVGASVDAMRILLRNPEPARFHHDRVARAVIEAFERLSALPMPTGREATRARRRADRLGWARPLAWGLDIDDPAATPYSEPPRRPGRPENLTAVLEDFDWLMWAGESPEKAAERVGVTLRTIDQYRLRQGKRAAS